jgi:hypothetical protein
MRTVTLTAAEIAVLDRQDPSTASDGGYQSFLVDLARRVDKATGRLDLYPDDLERIPRYAFDYGQGGWEDRLKSIFGRELGPELGR